MTTRRRFATNAVALAGYAGLSVLYFGLPLLHHPGRYELGTGQDPQIFIWSFAWWEHAFATGTNPFFSHAIYAPSGVNLAWATSVSGLAIPFAPLTALAGPIASYNVAALLMPTLAAWTAFLLCRYLTGSFLPSLVGGYLFGFSAYMVAQELGHMHLTSVFLMPLVVLVIVRYVRGDIDGRGLAWRLGLLLGWQLWISTEVVFTLTLALLAALALAFAFVRDTRPRLRSLAAPLVASYGVAVIVAAPFVWYLVRGFQSESISIPSGYDTAVLNVVVPTRLLAVTTAHLSRIAGHFPSGVAEQNAYLGVPTLAIVAWFGISRRRSPAARFLIAALAVAFLASLGTAFHVKGGALFRLPWYWIAKLPLFDNALPERFGIYMALAAAVIVALWMRSHRRWYGVLLAALAVAALVPAFWDRNYKNVPERWPFFTQAMYKICIPKGENVAIFPYGEDGYSTTWQAETGFWFRIAEGYLLPKPPKPFIDDPVVQKLTYTYENAGLREIRAFAYRNHVDRIISVVAHNHPNGTVMKALGPTQWIGGVMVTPACGYPPLKN